MSRIHITGASGSGVTTLGAALAHALNSAHLDTDDFFWTPSEPPYQTPRARTERLDLLQSAFADAGDRWVLSGSLNGWGDPVIARFDCVIFLFVPPEIRLARIEGRERARFGAAIAPGGALHEKHLAFMAWAARYDDPTFTGRSYAGHVAWLAALPCPVLRLDGAQPTSILVDRALGAAGAGG